MKERQDIRQLMKSGMDEDQSSSRVSVALSRARRQVGQRDTLSFALVRLWSVLARLLSPLFAAVGERQAQAIHQQTTNRPSALRIANEQESIEQEKGDEK